MANGDGELGSEETLSSWAGPYVTDMLGRGKALAEQPYTAYTGPLTAGESTLQSTAFGGLNTLAIPTTAESSYTPTSFTSGVGGAGISGLSLAPEGWYGEDGATGTGTMGIDPSTIPVSSVASQYMSPYIQSALEPQLAEARREAEIQNLLNRARMTKAGAYGGSRQALLESEGQRNLLRNLADITGGGYQKAYETGMQQFNTEQDRAQLAAENARRYGLDVRKAQTDAGAVQRGITSEGIAADIGQFKEERDDPYKKVQYMQSLLQDLPTGSTSYDYRQPSTYQNVMSGASDFVSFLDSILSLPT